MSSAVIAATIAAVSATAAVVSTVASTIYQGRQFRDQRELLQHQAELFGLQAEDLREATTQRRMQQALFVRLDNWVSRLVPKISGDSPPVAEFFRRSDEAALISSVRVCNESNRPIRNVQVRFASANARWARLNDGTTMLRAPLSGLGPSRSAWFDSGYLDAYADSVTLRFTDVDGNNWETGTTGDISALGTRDW
ncbi:MAG TPA: hypothetical protein VGS19_25460 [Streptosporangiaceae bacterium]|nr:hypothetical protein [Streptosporangiaceae bacterium]